MYESCKKGLDLRSPDHRLTFRNRIAKELHRRSAREVREEAARLTGRDADSFTRPKAVEAIVKYHLDALQSSVAA